MLWKYSTIRCGCSEQAMNYLYCNRWVSDKNSHVIYNGIDMTVFCNKNPVSNSEVVVTEKGNTLCYDGVFGRYFMSDKYAIKDAMNNVNRQIVNDMYASLNDFYDELGLTPVDIGYDLGWNIDDKRLDVEFDYGRADNDNPCLVIGFNVAPKYNYNKLF